MLGPCLVVMTLIVLLIDCMNHACRSSAHDLRMPGVSCPTSLIDILIVRCFEANAIMSLVGFCHPGILCSFTGGKLYGTSISTLSLPWPSSDLLCRNSLGAENARQLRVVP